MRDLSKTEILCVSGGHDDKSAWEQGWENFGEAIAEELGKLANDIADSFYPAPDPSTASGGGGGGGW